MHMANALSDDELKLIDAYWRAASYLSVGQDVSGGESRP
jgi:phosphoketolase